MLPDCLSCEELAKRYEALKRLRAQVEAAEQNPNVLMIDPLKYIPPTAPNTPPTAVSR